MAGVTTASDNWTFLYMFCYAVKPYTVYGILSHEGCYTAYMISGNGSPRVAEAICAKIDCFATRCHKKLSSV